MYNDEMLEVSDYDEDIQAKQDLINEIKSIQENNDGNVDMRAISDLQRRWKRIPYWESAFEDNLRDEFESYVDAFYGKRKEGYQINEKVKRNLIEEAKKVSQSSDWNKATKEMSELMTQWKAVGTSGKDSDDALWEEFNSARQAFFDRKHQNWEDMKAKFANALQVKQELIVKATAIADSEDWQKTSVQFKSLMDQWKAAGSAGREHEDALWNEFNEARQKFYDKRNKHYEELREEYAQKYEAKKTLIEKAKEVLASEEYTRNNTEKMKLLSNEWKTIGSCGKEKEDKVWKAFRNVMDEYFDGLRQFNDQKHEHWRQKMIDARSRKQEQIQNQKRQIQYIQDDMVGLLGERAIEEAKEQMEEKKEFIQQLEVELADIEKALAE